MISSPIKLVCFDLDCTILNGRLNYSLGKAGVPPGKADRETLDFHLKNVGGIKNRMALQRTIKDLLKNGVNVAITSFSSHPESIPYVLEKIGLTPGEIARIKDASTRPPEQAERHAFGKNNHIQRAMAMFPGENIQPQEVVLVDDNLRNFDLAKKHGYNVVWVQGSEVNVDYLNEVRELAGLSALRTVIVPDKPESWVDRVLGAVGLRRISAARAQ